MTSKLKRFYDHEYDYTKDIKVNWHRMNRWLGFVVEFLPRKKGLSMLDVGCGIGGTYLWAKDHDIKWTGLDFSDTAITMGKIYFGAEITRGNMQNMPYKDSSFDYVVALGSIEHTEDINRTLGEINRVCKPLGKIVIGVPCRIPLLDKLGIDYGTEQTEAKFTWHEWRQRFDNAGIEVWWSEKDYGPPIFKNLKFVPMLKRIAAKLTHFTPRSISYAYIFGCHPRGTK